MWHLLTNLEEATEEADITKEEEEDIVDVRDTDHIHETAGVPRGVTSPEAIPAGDPGLQAHQGIHLGDLQEDTRVVQGAQATTKTGTKCQSYPDV